MESSNELKELWLRFYEAVSRGDTAFMEQLVSNQPGMLGIGTDPDEWWTDSSTMVGVLQAQAQAGIQVLPGDAQAYREGSVGWVADRGSFRLPDGSEIPFRVTAVFHREEGDWKMVQEHASIAVSNEEALGQELTG